MAVLQYHYRPILSFQPNAIPLLFFCSFTVHFLDVNPFCYAAEQRCAILRYMEWNYSSVDFFYLKSMFGFCLKIVCCLVFVLDWMTQSMFFFQLAWVSKNKQLKIATILCCKYECCDFVPKKGPFTASIFFPCVWLLYLLKNYRIWWKMHCRIPGENLLQKWNDKIWHIVTNINSYLLVLKNNLIFLQRIIKP